MAGIKIRGLAKAYDDHAAVQDLDLDIQEGEFLTLLGPSGCGKTTTLRCVAGLEQPDAGSIEIGDDVIFDAARGISTPPERRNIGMVFQSYALWPHMTVFGNVAYPLRVRRVPRRQIRPLVEEALRLVDLQDMITRPVGNMSGGQQQRVALARALVAKPRVLLFDEPLSNLDATLRAAMRTELQELHGRVPTTSLYVTHDQLEALTLSDRIVVMRAGRVQQIGTPVEIYTHPANQFVAEFVGFDNFISGTVTASSDGVTAVSVPGLARPLECRNGKADVGEQITLAARSNAITVGSSPDAFGDESIPAQVLAMSYLGEHMEYLLAMGDRSVKVRVSTSAPVAATTCVGDEVSISIAGSAVHPLRHQPA